MIRLQCLSMILGSVCKFRVYIFVIIITLYRQYHAIRFVLSSTNCKQLVDSLNNSIHCVLTGFRESGIPEMRLNLKKYCYVGEYFNDTLLYQKLGKTIKIWLQSWSSAWCWPAAGVPATSSRSSVAPVDPSCSLSPWPGGWQLRKPDTLPRYTGLGHPAAGTNGPQRADVEFSNVKYGFQTTV